MPTLACCSPLWALEISDHPGVAEAEPAVKYVGGVHGDEPTGRVLTLALGEWLCANFKVCMRMGGWQRKGGRLAWRAGRRRQQRQGQQQERQQQRVAHASPVLSPRFPCAACSPRRTPSDRRARQAHRHLHAPLAGACHEPRRLRGAHPRQRVSGRAGCAPLRPAARAGSTRCCRNLACRCWCWRRSSCALVARPVPAWRSLPTTFPGPIHRHHASVPAFLACCLQRGQGPQSGLPRPPGLQRNGAQRRRAARDGGDDGVDAWIGALCGVGQHA